MQSTGTQSKFRRTLLASAISLAFAGASGFAVAGAQTGEPPGAPGAGQDTQAQQPGMAEQPQDQAALGTEDQAMTEQPPTGEDPMAAEGPGMPGEISEDEARQLVGQPLMGPDGEQLGQIEQVVRDDQGQLALVVSEEGDALGIGEQTQRVVPIDQVELEEHASLMQDDLAQMEEFQEGQYETVASAEDMPQDQAAVGEQPQPPEDQAAIGEQPQPPEDQAAIGEQPPEEQQPGGGMQ